MLKSQSLGAAAVFLLIKSTRRAAAVLVRYFIIKTICYNDFYSLLPYVPAGETGDAPVSTKEESGVGECKQK
jgi:hypothetical protein